MAKKINIEVECPNCGNKFTLTNLDSLAFVHTCSHEICEMQYLVAIDAKRLTAHTELVLTGQKAKEHHDLLLSITHTATKEQIEADEDRMCGFYHDGVKWWVAFDNSDNNCFEAEFETEKEAIEWLASSIKEKVTADSIQASQKEEKTFWINVLFIFFVTYSIGFFLYPSQARADNAHDLKAFIDGGTSQQTPTSKAPTAIKKAAYKPLDYLRLRDAVAGGAVEPSYTAIAFFAQTSPDETERAIKALERGGVIRWNSKKSKWELVK